MKEKDNILKTIMSNKNDNIVFTNKDDVVFTTEGRHSKPEVSAYMQMKIDEHGKLCDYLKNLYATKNADYGDSMHPLFEDYGLTAFLVLFGIKIQRIRSLNEKGTSHYESLEDSLLDLANYALIAVTELRAQGKDVQEDELLKAIEKSKWGK